MSINAKELRIGNIAILHRGDDLYGNENRKLDAIDINVAFEEPERFSPIPLTPEILEKCGFVGKYKSCGYHYKKDIVSLSSQDEDDFGNPIKDYVLHFYHNYQGHPIYYVHQLQNLYYALTGEELDTKNILEN